MAKTLTLKGFLAKTNTRAANSAGAFLNQYREFLETGELAQFTSPILAKIDSKELLPTPGLKEITGVVFAHMMAQESVKVEKALAKSSEPKVEKPSEATIYNGKGEVVVIATDDGETVLQKGFILHQDAERWIDRRLIESSPDCYGEIIQTRVKDRNGHGMKTLVTREESFGRVYKSKKMASHKKTGVSMSKLGFGVKAKNDHFHFSHG